MLFDRQGRCLMTNRTGLALMAAAAEEIVGRSYAELWPAEFTPAVEGAVQQVLAGRQAIFDACRMAGLAQRWWRVILTPVRDAEGEVRQYMAISTDITESRNAELALRASEENLRITLDSIDEGVIVTDAAGCVVRLNPVAEELTGWTRAQALRAPLASVFVLLGADARAREPHPADRVLRSGEVVRLQDRDHFLETRSGAKRRVVLSCAPIRGQRGAAVGAVLAFRDVTDQYLTEERLRHSQKMEGIGQLAGGIAHDFNNMLSGVLGFAQLIAERYPEEEHRRGYAKSIIETAERAAGLTAKLLSFSRKGRMESVSVDVHATIEDTLSLLERSIDPRITLERRLEARSCVLIGDPSEIQSALLNLCLNARDAMPEGGVLRIETADVELSKEHCARSAFLLAPGPYLRVRVSDSGVGMSEEVLERIFDPYFTTKGVGRGTGLGLAAVYGAVKEHQGEIDVTSRPGAGTTFRVHLPVCRAASGADAAREARPGRPRGSGCILVVEDEPMVRRATCLLLESFGYEVLEAADGISGLAQYRLHRARIDGVFLDVRMPGMDGRECFRAIRRVNPEARVVLTSGFSGDDIVPTLGGEGLLAFLKKPVSKAELARAASLLTPGAEVHAAQAGRSA